MLLLRCLGDNSEIWKNHKRFVFIISRVLSNDTFHLKLNFAFRLKLNFSFHGQLKCYQTEEAKQLLQQYILYI